jgi:hypothetical protein
LTEVWGSVAGAGSGLSGLRASGSGAALARICAPPNPLPTGPLPLPKFRSPRPLPHPTPARLSIRSGAQPGLSSKAWSFWPARPETSGLQGLRLLARTVSHHCGSLCGNAARGAAVQPSVSFSSDPLPERLERERGRFWLNALEAPKGAAGFTAPEPIVGEGCQVLEVRCPPAHRQEGVAPKGRTGELRTMPVTEERTCGVGQGPRSHGAEGSPLAPWPRHLSLERPALELRRNVAAT